jgi:hypothetical protein
MDPEIIYEDISASWTASIDLAKLEASMVAKLSETKKFDRHCHAILERWPARFLL